MAARSDGTAGFALAEELPPRRRRGRRTCGPDPRPPTTRTTSSEPARRSSSIAFAGTGLALLARPGRGSPRSVGLDRARRRLLVAALALDPTVRLDIGGTALVSSPYLRLFLILGAFTGLLLVADRGSPPARVATVRP